ncbi:hypothetical protein DPMN_085935 [Dreissena polymorpha]|uniref:Uncharacterized protein n=1 Tax=Dreissena polymorpha TaxID=45954 RepID=A0A9D3YH06_DREPO|nr:hypothetical protein DPMN_085935 [Dreissena polymorpha]
MLLFDTGCPALQNISHGYVNSSGLNNGDIASYACELGYTLSSSVTRFCTSNRTWNSSEPSCELITCPSPLAPVNGALNLNESSFGDRAIYSCNVGYYLSSCNISTCNASGRWDTPAPTCILHDCGNISNPLNGLVNFAATTYGAVANYICDVGYNLNGSNSSTCNGTGQWDRKPPTCTPIDCGPMLNPSNGHVSYFSTTYGNIANFSCNVGYFMNGSNSTTCVAEGHWLTTNPDCARFDCGQLYSPVNGTVTVTNTTYGAIANYSCDTGYSMVGHESTTCNSTGHWNKAAPVCSQIVCGNITITNGLVSYSGEKVYGDHANITCNAGYQLSGPLTRTCLGNWSQPESSCIAKGQTIITIFMFVS